MRIDVIKGVIADPDPKFIEIIEALPEPKPEHLPKIKAAMPQFYAFFVRKQVAYQKRDYTEFERVLEEEIVFVQDLDELAFNY